MALGDPLRQARPPRVPKPPVSSGELVGRVEALLQAGTTKPARVLTALRASSVSPWNAEHVSRLAQHLATLDPDWWLRLQVLVRGLPSKRGEFSGLLHKTLIDQAQGESSYPISAEDETAFVAWAQTAMAKTRKAPALLFAASWSDRKAPWHPTISLGILRDWAGPKPPRGLTPSLIASRIASTATGQKRAAEIAMLLQTVLRRRDQAIAEAQTRTEEAERARRARFKAEEELRSVNLQLNQTNDQLIETRGRVDALAAELEAARTAAQHDLRVLRTEMGSELGKLRSRVIGVLRHELQQTRLYLDRPHPNVADALARLGHIDALRAELEQQIGDVRAKPQ